MKKRIDMQVKVEKVEEDDYVLEISFKDKDMHGIWVPFCRGNTSFNSLVDELNELIEMDDDELIQQTIGGYVMSEDDSDTEYCLGNLEYDDYMITDILNDLERVD